MPKPVLSDSLFNADDVATAVLAEANLQIANNAFAVSDISSDFTLQTGWTASSEHFLYTNGFVFWSGYYYHSGGTPSHNEVFIINGNSNYRPNSRWEFPAIGYEGDTSASVRLESNGDIKINLPGNVGGSTYYIVVNGFWHTSY